MIEQHTPGPWKVDDEFLVRGGEHGYIIAEVSMSRYGGSRLDQRERIANAALIAQAPTLKAELDATNEELVVAEEAIVLLRDERDTLKAERDALRDVLGVILEECWGRVDCEECTLNPSHADKCVMLEARALLAGMEGNNEW